MFFFHVDKSITFKCFAEKIHVNKLKKMKRKTNYITVKKHLLESHFPIRALCASVAEAAHYLRYMLHRYLRRMTSLLHQSDDFFFGGAKMCHEELSFIVFYI